MELSQDGSLLIFVETTGKDVGPFGSRIVVWSVHKWQILKILDVDRKIDSCVFIPGKPVLATICDKQPELKQPYSIVLIDLSSEEQTVVGPTLLEKPVSLACPSRDVLFATLNGDSSILSYSLANPGAAPKKTVSSNPGGFLSVDPEGRLLACSGKEGIDFFSIQDLAPSSKTTRPIPEGLSELGPVLIIDKDTFVVGPSAEANVYGDAVLIRDGVARCLLKNASDNFAYNSKAKLLFVSSRINGTVIPVQFPDLEPSNTFTPGSLSPQTSGSPDRILYFKAHDVLGLLDSAGNFYVLKKSVKDKTWHKTLLFVSSNVISSVTK